MKRIAITLAALACAWPVLAAEKPKSQSYELSPSDLGELRIALSIADQFQRIIKDGQNEKQATEYVVLPPGLGELISFDLRQLKGAIEDYQFETHKILGQMTGGTGYAAPKSVEEALVNYRVAELSRVKIHVDLAPLPKDELLKANTHLSPTVRSALEVIFE
jgi:hypothetical protein